MLSVLSLIYLGIDWPKLFSRVPDIGVVFWQLAHLDVSRMDLVLSSLVETISIAVLSLLYSLLLGVVFGMLAARNVFHVPMLSTLTQSFFTFLRAVPTPVWVLLMLVCLGMGPEAGVAGLCVHTTAFFTKSFAQSFESIPDETIEALEATGTGRLSIFFNAVLPASLSQIVAWAGMRLETNFSECAILAWSAQAVSAMSFPTACKGMIMARQALQFCWYSWLRTASSGCLYESRRNFTKRSPFYLYDRSLLSAWADLRVSLFFIASIA